MPSRAAICVALNCPPNWTAIRTGSFRSPPSSPSTGRSVSWVGQLDAADEAQLDLDQVLGALVAIAPIVGTLRIVSAARKIVRAAGLADTVDES